LGGRCIDELPRSPVQNPKPEDPRSKPKRVALLKHSQRSFVRTIRRPKTPNHPNRKAPPPALLFLPSTMSKNRRKPPNPKPPTKIQAIKPARSPSALCAEVNKASHPQRGAALGETYIGPTHTTCQAIGR